MLAELRVRAQACRDTNHQLRVTTGGQQKIIPHVLNPFDPFDDQTTLESVLPGSFEVVRLLEHFTKGERNAQHNQKLAAEARARQQQKRAPALSDA